LTIRSKMLCSRSLPIPRDAERSLSDARRPVARRT
jgi:hypothetical protein